MPTPRDSYSRSVLIPAAQKEMRDSRLWYAEATNRWLWGNFEGTGLP